MTRYLSIYLIIILISCSETDSDDENAEITLLQSKIWTFNPGQINEISTTWNYFYQDKFLKKMTYEFASWTETTAWITTQNIREMNYENENLVSEIIKENNIKRWTYEYSYDNNNQLSSQTITRFEDDGYTVKSIQTFKYLKSNNGLKYTKYNENNEPIEDYFFDSNNNLLNVTGSSYNNSNYSQDKKTYDNYKNPLKNIKGNMGIHGKYISKNNYVTRNLEGLNGSTVTKAWRCQELKYNYNSEGYPISLKSTDECNRTKEYEIIFNY